MAPSDSLITDATPRSGRENEARKLILTSIVKIAQNPNIPISLRALTVSILGTFMVMSFQFCIFCMSTKAHPEIFALVFMAEFLATIALTMLLIPRLGSYGEAKRLEEKFSTTAEKKKTRQRAAQQPMTLEEQANDR